MHSNLPDVPGSSYGKRQRMRGLSNASASRHARAERTRPRQVAVLTRVSKKGVSSQGNSSQRRHGIFFLFAAPVGIGIPFPGRSQGQRRLELVMADARIAVIHTGLLAAAARGRSTPDPAGRRCAGSN